MCRVSSGTTYLVLMNTKQRGHKERCSLLELRKPLENGPRRVPRTDVVAPTALGRSTETERATSATRLAWETPTRFVAVRGRSRRGQHNSMTTIIGEERVFAIFDMLQTWEVRTTERTTRHNSVRQMRLPVELPIWSGEVCHTTSNDRFARLQLVFRHLFPVFQFRGADYESMFVHRILSQ